MCDSQRLKSSENDSNANSLMNSLADGEKSLPSDLSELVELWSSIPPEVRASWISVARALAKRK
jgi:hypothetical protein